MPCKSFLTTSVGALLGMTAMMPAAALAQFGPPPGPPPVLAGPPPGLAGPPPGLGGFPPGLVRPPTSLGMPNVAPSHVPFADARPGRDAARFSGAGGPAAVRGFEGRSARTAPPSSTAAYTRYGHSGFGYGHGRGRYWPDGVYAAYGSSDASSEDEGCYYTSAYRRGAYRRVLICSGD